MKWHETPAIDEAIRRAWGHKGSRRGAVRIAMQATDWSRAGVYRRAVELGLAQTRSEYRGTAAEEAVVRDWRFSRWDDPAAPGAAVRPRAERHAAHLAGAIVEAGVIVGLTWGRPLPRRSQK